MYATALAFFGTANNPHSANNFSLTCNGCGLLTTFNRFAPAGHAEKRNAASGPAHAVNVEEVKPWPYDPIRTWHYMQAHPLSIASLFKRGNGSHRLCSDSQRFGIERASPWLAHLSPATNLGKRFVLFKRERWSSHRKSPQPEVCLLAVEAERFPPAFLSPASMIFWISVADSVRLSVRIFI